MPPVAAPFPPPSMPSVASLTGQKQAATWMPPASAFVAAVWAAAEAVCPPLGQAGCPGFSFLLLTAGLQETCRSAIIYRTSSTFQIWVSNDCVCVCEIRREVLW